jgi:hypothetical protein
MNLSFVNQNLFHILLSPHSHKKLTVFFNQDDQQIKSILKKAIFHHEIEPAFLYDLYISATPPPSSDILKPGALVILSENKELLDEYIYPKQIFINNLHVLYKSLLENLKNPTFIKNNMVHDDNYKMTIITPCFNPNPDNLQKIKNSIDFKYVDEWIIIYDCKIKDLHLSFKNSMKIKEMCINKVSTEDELINKATESASKLNTFIYILPDSTPIHPNISSLFEFHLLEKKCYSFNQDRQKNNIVLKGTLTPLIESNMFLFYRNAYKDIKYTFAPEFIKKCHDKDPENYIYIDSTLAYSSPI